MDASRAAAMEGPSIGLGSAAAAMEGLSIGCGSEERIRVQGCRLASLV
jgi:hypothetical protein